MAKKKGWHRSCLEWLEVNAPTADDAYIVILIMPVIAGILIAIIWGN